MLFLPGRDRSLGDVVVDETKDVYAFAHDFQCPPALFLCLRIFDDDAYGLIGVSAFARIGGIGGLPVDKIFRIQPERLPLFSRIQSNLAVTRCQLAVIGKLQRTDTTETFAPGPATAQVRPKTR